MFDHDQTNVTPLRTPGRIDWQEVADLTRRLLVALGEDPERDGLRDTPRRVADWWREFIEYDAGRTETTFEAITTEQMVVASGMKVWSLCEHHLLPFWAEVTVGYIARERVIGLSKLGRIAHRHAHALQIQERLVQQIADEVARVAATPDVAVIARGEHLCMSMRGIRTPALMTTSVLRGTFQKAKTRDEFLRLARV